MTLIADIVNDITANPAPALFLDTCILLDVVRAPLRNKPDEVRFGRIFLDAAQKIPKNIHLLIPSPVMTEWDTHILERENECRTAVDACNAVSAICGHLALPAVAVLPAAVLTLPEVLRQLSTDLLAACVTIDHDADALGRAVNRIIASTHPVKRPDSKGAKDAVILEHAVQMTGQLRIAGFAGDCLFVSSNTKDYAAPGSTNLNLQLVPSFNHVGLGYAVSLTDAHAVLIAGGWIP
jgi:hypothetical protein